LNTAQVNYLNIGLMAISLLAAFILPFEVFLFSYAILGPLHYLTEISWLHDRKYFSPGKFDYIPLLVFTLLFVLGSGTMVLGAETTANLKENGLETILTFLERYSYDMTFLAFGLALLFILSKDWRVRLGGTVLLLLAAWFFHAPEPYNIDAAIESDGGLTQTEWNSYLKRMDDRSSSLYLSIFAVYLPTLIHVYVFTGAFILFGALKRNSKSGYASFVFFIFCAAACFFILPNAGYYSAGEWARENYQGGFETLSMYLMRHFGGLDWPAISEIGANDPEFVYSYSTSILFARFIAFAYTYHYLNWFSKTSVIRWHKVPKLRFVGVIALWVGSIALYLYNYTIGFQWLFLLSFAHVVLEFPLNHQSFIGIGQEIGKRISRRPAQSGA